MNCINCGKETRVYIYRRKEVGGNKYCSKKCKDDFHAKKTKVTLSTINCLICSKEFMPKSKRGKYCSDTCKKKAELLKRSKKPLEKQCKCCGIKFRPYTSLDKFCSANCRVEHQKSKRSRRWSKEKVEKIKGTGNPAYRNGYYLSGATKTAIGEKLFIKNRKLLAKSIIEKKGYLHCERCGQSNTKFDTHHIIYRSEKPNHEHLHNVKNLIILCVPCHNYFHKSKKTRVELVKERALNEMFGNDVLDKFED
jgi:hypothetical protein